MLSELVQPSGSHLGNELLKRRRGQFGGSQRDSGVVFDLSVSTDTELNKLIYYQHVKQTLQMCICPGLNFLKLTVLPICWTPNDVTWGDLNHIHIGIVLKMQKHAIYVVCLFSESLLNYIREEVHKIHP